MPNRRVRELGDELKIDRNPFPLASSRPPHLIIVEAHWGGGFLGGLLSSVLGGGLPGFARGTNYAPGGLAVVGERGPEIVNLPRGSQVIPNHRIRAAGGGGSVVAPVTINIDATGADAAGLARVQVELASLKRELPKQIVAVQAQQGARGVV